MFATNTLAFVHFHVEPSKKAELKKHLKELGPDGWTNGGLSKVNNEGIAELHIGRNGKTKFEDILALVQEFGLATQEGEHGDSPRSVHFEFRVPFNELAIPDNGLEAYKAALLEHQGIDKKLSEAADKAAKAQAELEALNAKKKALATQLGLDTKPPKNESNGKPKATGTAGELDDKVFAWFVENGAADDLVKFPVEKQQQFASVPTVSKAVKRLIAAGKLRQEGRKYKLA